jgi:hypothetical protein
MRTRRIWLRGDPARAAERGISEAKLANHLHLSATVLKWVLRTGPDATTDRSIELD